MTTGELLKSFDTRIALSALALRERPQPLLLVRCSHPPPREHAGSQLLAEGGAVLRASVENCLTSPPVQTSSPRKRRRPAAVDGTRLLFSKPVAAVPRSALQCEAVCAGANLLELPSEQFLQNSHQVALY